MIKENNNNFFKNFYNNPYFIHKKIKLLIEITFEPKFNFIISPKLTMFLNQYGLYELDKFNNIVNNYFNMLKNWVNFRDNFSILVPFIIIFPKRKINSIVYIISPFTNEFLSELIWLNILDFYFLLFTKISFVRYLLKHITHKVLKLKYFKILKKLKYLNKKKFKKKKLKYYSFFYKKRFLLKSIKIFFLFRYKFRKIALFGIRKKYKKVFKNFFLGKSKYWLFLNLLFKLTIFKISIIHNKFNYINFKIYLNTFYNLIRIFKIFIRKRLKKKKKFKRLIKRNIYGDIIYTRNDVYAEEEL